MISLLAILAKTQRSPGSESEIVLVVDGVGDAGRLLAFCCQLLVPSQLDIMRNSLLTEISQTTLCSIHHYLALLHIEVDHGTLTLVVRNLDTGNAVGIWSYICLNLESSFHIGSNPSKLLGIGNRSISQILGFLSQSIHFWSYIFRNIILAVILVKLQLSRQTIGTTVLLERSKVGILPVAHPGDT